MQNLYDRIEVYVINIQTRIHTTDDVHGLTSLNFQRMQRFGPEFVDVTWGAGGTSADLTTEIVATAQAVYGIETMMHLTCTNMPKEQVDYALKVKCAMSIHG